jgi:hypothetical protein
MADDEIKVYECPWPQSRVDLPLAEAAVVSVHRLVSEKV